MLGHPYPPFDLTTSLCPYLGATLAIYLVPERKLGFFVQIKKGENFNRRNTMSISRIKI